MACGCGWVHQWYLWKVSGQTLPVPSCPTMPHLMRSVFLVRPPHEGSFDTPQLLKHEVDRVPPQADKLDEGVLLSTIACCACNSWRSLTLQMKYPVILQWISFRLQIALCEASLSPMSRASFTTRWIIWAIQQIPINSPSFTAFSMLGPLFVTMHSLVSVAASSLSPFSLIQLMDSSMLADVWPLSRTWAWNRAHLYLANSALLLPTGPRPTSSSCHQCAVREI